ncbi:class I SAM-dependent DNA methyltransferase [Falsibacillus albus]|uniref:Class I SAM-dependent methyltransferase n=1 Tax=Falsibacillus albus TaxID=2478915 RepID=A0A3L7K7D3_9BACI|nr:class I SAM-dependent methyltransferase [Falsibacillus albus]RLQ98154.1 class I SAM-dependent methyltransferase [Falsibacillus albus]
MSYSRFAYVYDFLMKDMPYSQWMELVREKQTQYEVNGDRVLDLGCGTGELSIGLAEMGYDVTGVDLSEDMLMVAKDKAENSNVAISFYHQDMSEIEGLGLYDVITIFCDSLCYLTEQDQVRRTFNKAFEHLKSGGLFLFDVHSIYKMTQIFMNQTFALNDEEVSYIWNCFPGEAPNSVEHDLTFFVEEESGYYSRFDEFHTQRTYPVIQLEKWLNEEGFLVHEVLGDFSGASYTELSERIFFICQKKTAA